MGSPGSSSPTSRHHASRAIRRATERDLEAVLSVERVAFGEEDEAELVRLLLADPTAEPRFSLLAEEPDPRGGPAQAVGHVLFTHGVLESDGAEVCPVTLLAPLAVVPERQRCGIGGELIEAGVREAVAEGYGLMLVLGHPSYYPRHGFVTAADHGIFAPYPTEPIEAFMVRELRPGILTGARGMLRPAAALMRPEYWQE